MPVVSAAVSPLLRGDAPPDEELVRRALEGDRWAEEALYRRHVQKVTAVTARLLRHGADIEDVVQDTFIDALRDLPTLREPAYVGRWLVRIAVHKVQKRFRRRKLRRLLGLERDDHDEPLARQAGPSVNAETRAELALLDRVLDRMSGDDKSAWVLRHLEGYALEEVAELCNCSLATIKRRIARADAMLAEHFGIEEVRDA